MNQNCTLLTSKEFFDLIKEYELATFISASENQMCGVCAHFNKKQLVHVVRSVDHTGIIKSISENGEPLQASIFLLGNEFVCEKILHTESFAEMNFQSEYMSGKMKLVLTKKCA